MRGATDIHCANYGFWRISIHAPHAGRDIDKRWQCVFHTISIHAPHAGRDPTKASALLPIASYFNPRAPCGARPRIAARRWTEAKFQSTRPMRGATVTSTYSDAATLFQSTRPMRGATHLPAPIPRAHAAFQSTRPMRGATTGALRMETGRLFQSTRPMRGATPKKGGRVWQGQISIHAPHAGRDRFHSHCVLLSQHFNPRAPCGARLTASEPVAIG